jgi:hypothetical protein
MERENLRQLHVLQGGKAIAELINQLGRVDMAGVMCTFIDDSIARILAVPLASQFSFFLALV